MRTILPVPVIERLCKLFTLVSKLNSEGKTSVSSAELEKITGIQAHSIRKDLSMLGPVVSGKGGYSTGSLETLIESTFGFEKKRKVCVAGLDMAGLEMLKNPDSSFSGFEISAGFDSNINRMEMLSTKVPLFHFYEIEEKIRILEIDFAILAVPPENAHKIAARLISGGIKGILNFSPVILAPKQNVIIRNIYLAEELRLLSALLSVKEAAGVQNS